MEFLSDSLQAIFRLQHTWAAPAVGFSCFCLVWSLVQRFRPGHGSLSGSNSSIVSDPILDALEQSKFSERRQSVRRTGNPVAVSLTGRWTHELICEGCVMDRSTGGLGIIVPQEFAVDTILCVRTLRNRDPLARVPIQVRHCRRLNNGEWMIGCQYRQERSSVQMLQFG
jgi:hypothetical protein